MATHHDTLRGYVNRMRMVTIAMMYGSVTLLGILGYLGWKGVDTQFSIEAIISIAVGVVALVGALIVPGIVLRAGCDPHVTEAAGLRQDSGNPQVDMDETLSGPERKMLACYQQSVILGSALLEAGATVAAVLFLISSSTICLGVGVALVVLLAGRMPTVGRTTDWMENAIRNARRA